jgi:hypothetical protein
MKIKSLVYFSPVVDVDTILDAIINFSGLHYDIYFVRS